MSWKTSDTETNVQHRNDLECTFFEWFCPMRSAAILVEGTLIKYFRMLRGQGLLVF
jgi:hypothetical protein